MKSKHKININTNISILTEILIHQLMYEKYNADISGALHKIPPLLTPTITLCNIK